MSALPVHLSALVPRAKASPGVEFEGRASVDTIRQWARREPDVRFLYERPRRYREPVRVIVRVVPERRA